MNDWQIVRKVAEEMLNTSMHDIDARRIHDWAVRLGDLAVSKTETTTQGNAAMMTNGAVMRETLKLIIENLLTINAWGDKSLLDKKEKWVVEEAEKALAAPPRNCDVGTASEQIKRWEEFCIAHHEYWKPPSTSLTAIQRCNCPCLEGNGCNYFIWAQMPYEEGEAK